jgi:hypothetical protein
MSQAATRKDIDDVIDILQDFMKQVSGEFADVRSEVRGEFADVRSEVRGEFAEIKNRLDEQDKKYDRLISTIDGFISRIDRYETELAARDRQFEKLLQWARKVSEKTGVPLEDL